jgi:uncharacterized protein with PQ loop repeat
MVGSLYYELIILGKIYYYLIMFATLLFTFAFVPIVFEILQQKITSNIPYISLFSFLISFLIFLFIAIIKEYYIHSIFYSIGLLSVIILCFLKKSYDNKSIKVLVNEEKQNLIS